MSQTNSDRNEKLKSFENGKKTWKNKKESLEINLNLNLEFLTYCEEQQNLKKAQKVDPAEVLGLNKELNEICVANQKKLKELEELIENIKNTESRAEQSFVSEKEQLFDFNEKQLEAAEMLKIEIDEGKKLKNMKEKLEKHSAKLKLQIKEKDKLLKKISLQMAELSTNNYYFKNNASLAITKATNFKTISSNFRSDFESKYSQMQNSLYLLKEDSAKIVSRISEITSENQVKNNSKIKFYQILQKHDKILKENPCKKKYQKVLNNFYEGFQRISKIMNVEFGKDINAFANLIIDWLKKSEFRQISLTMHYNESSQEVIAKHKELKVLNKEKEFLSCTDSLNTENHYDKAQARKRVKINAKHKLEIEQTEKFILTAFYEILNLVKSIYSRFNSIEFTLKTRELRFANPLFKIEEILKNFSFLTLKSKEPTLRKKFPDFSENGFFFSLKSFGLHSLLTSELYEEITSNYQDKSPMYQLGKLIKVLHTHLLNTSKSLFTSFQEFLLLMNTFTNDMSVSLATFKNVSANSPQKYLLRVRSLLDTKSRVSFMCAEEAMSPYMKHEITSLENLLAPKFPKLTSKKHKRGTSEVIILTEPRRSISEHQAIEKKISSFRAKQKKVSAELLGVQSLTKFPQKFLVKSDIMKRLYNRTRSTSMIKFGSPTGKS